MNDPYRYQNQMAAQGAARGFYTAPTETTDDGIAILRRRAAFLRQQINCVNAWRAELDRIETTLVAWGDK